MAVETYPRNILEAIGDETLSFSEIRDRTGLDFVHLVPALIWLQRKGYIAEAPGRTFRRRLLAPRDLP
jgi:predicted Rossmann fold nucleotide-binding protein DprA/Smf involved in DNA uptake